MNLLQEHYRQLLNNWNFSKENRLVFQGGETLETEAPKPKAMEEADINKMIKKAEELHTKLGTKMKTLVNKYKKSNDKLSQDEHNALNKFDKRVDELQNQMKKEKKNQTKPAEEIAEQMHTDVQKLIDEIHTKLREEPAVEAKAIDTKEGSKEAVETAEKPPISMDDFFSLESEGTVLGSAIRQMIMDDFDKFVDSFKLSEEKKDVVIKTKNTLQAFAKEVEEVLMPLFSQDGLTDKYLQKMGEIDNKYSPSLRDFQKAIGVKNVDLRQVINNAYEHAMETEEYKNNTELAQKLTTAKEALEGKAKERAKEGKETEAEKTEKTTFIKANFDSLTNRLSDALGIPKNKKLDSKNPLTKDVITNILATLDIKKLQGAMGGKEMEISAKEDKEIRKILKKELMPKAHEKIEKGEQQALENLGEDESLGLPDKNMLDTDTKLNSIIATMHKIEEKDGKFKVDGVELTKGNILTQLPELKAVYTAAETKDSSIEDAIKTLEESSGNQLKAREAMKKIAEAFSDPEKIEKMGLLGGLAALLQLWGAFKAALDSKDWQTLNEMMSDFSKGESPAKNIAKSKEQYKDVLEVKTPKPNDPKQLIKAYLDPRGEEADKLFTEGIPETETEDGEKKFNEKALSKYRTEAKPAITTYLAKALGINGIKDITKLTSGIIDITAYDTNGEKISIEIKMGDKISARKIKYVEKPPAKEGLEATLVKPKEKGEWIKDIDNLTALADVAKSETVAKVPTPEEKIENQKRDIAGKILKGIGVKGVDVEIGYNNDKNSYTITVLKEEQKFTKTLKSNEITDEALVALIAEAKKSLTDKKEVPYKDKELDTKAKREEILKKAGQLGRGTDFKKAWLIAKAQINKGKDWNAPKWEKNWIKNNIPQTAEPAVAKANIKKITEVKPKTVGKEVKPESEVDESEPTPEPEVTKKPETKLFKEQITQISNTFKGSEIKFENGKYKFSINGVKGDFTIQKLKPDLPYFDKHIIKMNFPKISKIIQNVKKKDISSKIIEAIKGRKEEKTS